MELINKDFWVFGYGSLMWRPDFPYINAQRAKIYGYHRSLCALSTSHRGTKERPSLIAGLDRGGICIGYAFQVATKNILFIKSYLNDREMKSGVYEPRYLKVNLENGKRVKALTYIVCRNSPFYKKNLSVSRQVKLVLQGAGASGSGLEYLNSMVNYLDKLNIPCEDLRVVQRKALKKYNKEIKLNHT